jgi:probable F420-dependent oxidoreductase
MNTVRVGVQLHPQHCTIDELRAAWQAADALGVDSIWVWDHFYPLYGDPDGAHFEGWSLLAAMAVDTHHARLGALVSCNTYRNPDLLADIARTVDHLSGGRMYLGIGSGWFEREYADYGYPFGTRHTRMDALVASLDRIATRLAKLNPPPLGALPIMIGALGEKVALRVVATYADAWNTYGTPEVYATKNRVLTDWCVELGRDPAEIERTVLVPDTALVDRWRDYVESGAQHIIVPVGHPFDLTPVASLLSEARRPS